MQRLLKFGAVFEKHGSWYVGYIPQVPGVNAQERTLKETKASLISALEELATLDPDAVVGSKRHFEEVEIAIQG